MNSKTLLTISLAFMSLIKLHAQTNGFVISMMTHQGHAIDLNTPSGQNPSTYSPPTSINGNPTSVLNVLKADGFNTSFVTFPDPYITYEQYINYLKLCSNQGMKLIDVTNYWFKPNINGAADNNTVQKNIGFQHNGIEQYNNGPLLHFNQTGAGTDIIYYNYDHLFDILSGNGNLSDNIYMHELNGEFSFFHYFPRANEFPNYNDVNICGSLCCGTPNNMTIENLAYQTHISAEVPPINVSNAIDHFKGYNSMANLSNQKYAIGIATHGTSILKLDNPSQRNSFPFHNCPNGVSATPCEFCGTLNVKDHLIFPGITNPKKPDIIREASYYNNHFRFWGQNNWEANNYLGKFENIDYLHSLGYDHIIAENDLERGTAPTPYGMLYQYHSNLYTQNANMLRFLTYTSIIHGVDGVNFYTLGDSYGFDAGDVTRKDDLNTASLVDRFKRENFSFMYNTFVSKLGREIRYLANNNFVSPNNSNLIYKKTTSADGNGILQPSPFYLPGYITNMDARDYKAVAGGPKGSVFNPHRTEDYGLRYIITDNGNGEAVMIVSNPNPYSIHNVDFNFNQTFSNSNFNSIINNTKSIDVLFDDASVTDVNSINYKTNASASVSEGPAFNLLKKYSHPFCNKTFRSDFGPFDVKIFYFRGNASYTSNGWEKQWSNNGNGSIGSWGGAGALNSTDKFIPFDFNSDGDEELLCVQSLNSNAKVSVLNYDGTMWNGIWSNNGNGSFNNIAQSGWLVHDNDKYTVGDFNHDGKNNELLCVRGNYAVILQSNGTTFNWYWDNSGNGWFNSAPTGWAINAADKYQVGDFNGDGFNNDLLCIQPNTGYWALLNFSTTSSPVNFSWYWGQGGTLLNSWWNIGASDDFTVGDFDGNGVRDEILCMERSAGNYVGIIKKVGFGSSTEYYTSNGNISGWGSPIKASDKVIVGDVDTDTKDELMFLQTCAGCGYATTEDLNASNTSLQWNWSNHNTTGPQDNYIADWLVNEQCATDLKYLFIKPTTTSKKQLLAFKNYNGNYLISMYKANGTYNYKTTSNEDTNVSLVDAKKDYYFDLYPNPNNGDFKISMDNDRKKTIVVTDLLGRVVIETNSQEKETSIHLTNQPRGVYFVKVIEGINVGVRKIILE